MSNVNRIAKQSPAANSTVASPAAMLVSAVTDEALEAAVGDFRDVRCSQCGGTCDSRCSTSTR